MTGRPLLSVVVAVRDRAGKRFEYCLKSLLDQSLEKDLYEIVVVDHGSQPPLKSFVEGISSEIKYFYIGDFGEFNEAKAKNFGVRKARGCWVLITNADILFGQDVLEICEEYLKAADSNVFFQCTRKYIEKNDVDMLDFKALRSLAVRSSNYSATSASGDFLLIRKERFLSLDGYLEKFTGWGVLDLELHKRLLTEGLKEIRLEDKGVCITHLDHEINQRKCLKNILDNYKVRYEHYKEKFGRAKGKEKEELAHELKLIQKTIDYYQGEWDKFQAKQTRS